MAAWTKLGDVAAHGLACAAQFFHGVAEIEGSSKCRERAQDLEQQRIVPHIDFYM